MEKIKAFRINWSDKRSPKWKTYVSAELALRGETLVGYILRSLDKLADSHVKRNTSK